MSEKEALLPTKRIFCNQCSSKRAQVLRTTRPWNLISSTCNIPKHWKSTKTRSYL